MPPATVATMTANPSAPPPHYHPNGEQHPGTTSSSSSSITDHHHDDVYFGGAKRPGVAQQQQQESLLVQALQVPQLEHDPHNGAKNSEYYDDTHCYAQQQQPQNDFERLTHPMPPPVGHGMTSFSNDANSPSSLFNPFFPFQDQLEGMQQPSQAQQQQRQQQQSYRDQQSFSSMATKPSGNTLHHTTSNDTSLDVSYATIDNNNPTTTTTTTTTASTVIPISHMHHQSSNSNYSNDSQINTSIRSLASESGMMIGHSVDTVPTSNMMLQQQRFKRSMASPPPELSGRKHATQNSNNNNSNSNNTNGGRRNVFGGRVQKRYQPQQNQAPMHPQHYHHHHHHNHNNSQQHMDPLLMDDSSDQYSYLHDIPFYNIIENEHQQQIMQRLERWPPDAHVQGDTTTNTNDNSDMHETWNALPEAATTPPPRSPVHHRTVVTTDRRDNTNSVVSPLQSPPIKYNSISNHHQHNKKKKSRRIHETVHAQSLLLGLCFMAIWSPSNIMAPNLTQMADFFGMTEAERDLYLGSFLALATGVLSFPLSALIGIGTDLYSRKYLFVGTALGGALASAACGLAPNYACLVTARFLSGGFMSASVSVAFSLLGDLFAVEERNAASSGLTAMMGSGIILGQVYAGMVGSRQGWQHAFYVSSVVTACSGLAVALLVQEPVRGGKEKVLQEMLQQGKRYDRKLTWEGFWKAMQENQSNGLLMVQAFFGSLPWGIIFVFLNDYLSQERGFSVPDATFIVLLFGFGCALGGILGGYFGSLFQHMNRRFLPLFMAATTVLAILPFLGLLNGHTTNAHGIWASMYSIMGGMIASMPSVNVRPCLINVNPPETRGASLTANNLIVQLARGIGPSFITIMGTTFHVSRQVSFNATLTLFWVLSAMQLVMLARFLPLDQDKMEAELALYAASALARDSSRDTDLSVTESFQDEPVDRPDSSKSLFADDDTLVSIEDLMTSFDAKAVKESFAFIRKGVKELDFGSKLCRIPSRQCSDVEDDDEEGDEDGGNPSPRELFRKRDVWVKSQQRLASQTSQDDADDGALLSSRRSPARNSGSTFPDETTRLV